MTPHRFTKMPPQKRKPPECVKPQDVPRPSVETPASIRQFNQAIRLLARLESLAANTNDIAHENNEVCYFASVIRLIEAIYMLIC